MLWPLNQDVAQSIPCVVSALPGWEDFHCYELLHPMTKNPPVPGDTGREKQITETERVLFALAQAVEQRDRNTAGHCERLAFISVAMGLYLGFDKEQLLALYRGGYLHDIGKVGIPDSILFKRDRLNEDEWQVMRTHPLAGVEICHHLPALSQVIPLIRHHHERWDGSGYPDGLQGQQISLAARILQISDIYDALTGPRPYKPAFSPGKALRIIREETARGWRDPEIVDTFLALYKDVISKADDYTVGSDKNLEAMRSALLRLDLPR